MQAATPLVPDALEHDALGAAALLAAAPLPELAAGGQLRETVAGASGTLVAAAIRRQMCRPNKLERCRLPACQAVHDAVS